LAGALADGLACETLVIDVPLAGEPARGSADVDPADGDATIADAIRSRARLTAAVRPDEQTGVWRAADDRLPLRSPPAPWPALAALLGECRQHFAWTLIDGGSWDRLESAELARRCDCVYVVLHEGRTGRITARQTLAELHRAGARISSCLFVGRARRELSEA